MHIEQYLRGSYRPDFNDFLEEMVYVVRYKGFVAKDPDLGLAIARCYGAAANDN
tara:strand:- start:266 stop:427 length:162 start_codon:yes stop_codon:yes gene_type:complete